jgi:hypothetical protein
MVLQTAAGASVFRMDDSPSFFGAEYDTSNHRLTLTSQADKQKQIFQYSQPDSDHLLLEGEAVVVRLRKVDVSKFLLVNRGFNWINERPFNR